MNKFLRIFEEIYTSKPVDHDHVDWVHVVYERSMDDTAYFVTAVFEKDDRRVDLWGTGDTELYFSDIAIEFDEIDAMADKLLLQAFTELEQDIDEIREIASDVIAREVAEVFDDVKATVKKGSTDTLATVSHDAASTGNGMRRQWGTEL